MSEIEVENDIPIPPQGGGFLREGIQKTIYNMQPGQSFVLKPRFTGDNLDDRRRTALYAARRSGVKVVTRRVEEGIRVWRVE